MNLTRKTVLAVDVKMVTLYVGREELKYFVKFSVPPSSREKWTQTFANANYENNSGIKFEFFEKKNIFKLDFKFYF